MPRQRRGIRGDVGIAPYVPSTESVCVSHRADRVVRPYKGLKNTPPEVKRTKTTGEPHPNTTKERRGIAAALFM